MGFPKHQQVESAIRKNFKNHYHKPIAIKNVKHKAKWYLYFLIFLIIVGKSVDYRYLDSM